MSTARPTGVREPGHGLRGPSRSRSWSGRRCDRRSQRATRGRKSPESPRKALGHAQNHSVTADPRVLALVTLDLVSHGATDEELATRFVNHEAIAVGATYLIGFVVQALAVERAEPVSSTLASLRDLLGGGDGLGGVREPRRPSPSHGGAAQEMGIP